MAVYLIHFHQPISPNSTAQHYLGFSNHVEARIAYHRKGQSKVRLFEIAKQRGIGFDVVRIWEKGDRTLERRLKNRKNHRLFCPICTKKYLIGD